VNLSGKAVRYWLNKEKIDIENLLVISDDLNLEFGRIRLKPNGSDGGHNGLKDITNILGTSNYSRLRFGIGGNFSKGKQSDYVLSKWNKEELSEFIEIEPLFTEIVKSYVNQGIDKTMNKFNC
jgi:PTH1 family peptidyl-tRNA hydrolase